jgi:hypothetical protein
LTEWTYTSSSISNCGMLSAESKTRFALLNGCELEFGHQEAPHGVEIGIAISQILSDHPINPAVVYPPVQDVGYVVDGVDLLFLPNAECRAPREAELGRTIRRNSSALRERKSSVVRQFDTSVVHLGSDTTQWTLLSIIRRSLPAAPGMKRTPPFHAAADGNQG